MIKRPLNARFNDAVREGRKFTTIRDNPWPIRVPIMLYNWLGAAYRSKQVNIAEIQVQGIGMVQITHLPDGTMVYEHGMDSSLHESEGFDSIEEMDDWFRKKVKSGQTVKKYLMRFNDQAHPTAAGGTGGAQKGL